MSGRAPRVRGPPSRSSGPLSASAVPASMAGEPGWRWKSLAEANLGSALWLPPPEPSTGPALVRKFEKEMAREPLRHGPPMQPLDAPGTAWTSAEPAERAMTLRAVVVPSEKRTFCACATSAGAVPVVSAVTLRRSTRRLIGLEEASAAESPATMTESVTVADPPWKFSTPIPPALTRSWRASLQTRAAARRPAW